MCCEWQGFECADAPATRTAAKTPATAKTPLAAMSPSLTLIRPHVEGRTRVGGWQPAPASDRYANRPDRSTVDERTSSPRCQCGRKASSPPLVPLGAVRTRRLLRNRLIQRGEWSPARPVLFVTPRPNSVYPSHGARRKHQGDSPLTLDLVRPACGTIVLGPSWPRLCRKVRLLPQPPPSAGGPLQESANEMYWLNSAAGFLGR